eukprot:3010518-Rhodomonas_salina.1
MHLGSRSEHLGLGLLGRHPETGINIAEGDHWMQQRGPALPSSTSKSQEKRGKLSGLENVLSRLNTLEGSVGGGRVGDGEDRAEKEGCGRRGGAEHSRRLELHDASCCSGIVPQICTGFCARSSDESLQLFSTNTLLHFGTALETSTEFAPRQCSNAPRRSSSPEPRWSTVRNTELEDKPEKQSVVAEEVRDEWAWGAPAERDNGAGQGATQGNGRGVPLTLAQPKQELYQ